MFALDDYHKIAENETLYPKTYTPIYRHEKRQKPDDPAFPD